MFKSFLQFLRLVDENSQLSITNISVLSVLVKILLQNFGGGSTQTADLIALGLVLANYASKRLIRLFEKTKKPESSLESLTESVNKLKEELELQKNKVSSLSVAAGMRSPQQR